MQRVDVAIIGGGIVGLTVACGLHDSGMKIALLEQFTPEIISKHTPLKLRVSTINAASEKLLKYLDIWSDIPTYCISSFHCMEVWDKDNFGYIAFDDKSFGYSHLGHIIENSIIHSALWEKVQKYDDITLIVPANLNQIVWSEDEVIIFLQGGNSLTTRLLVGADGAESWLRKKAKIPIIFWNYRHHALVATIQTTEPHDSTARQVFHSDGILAFLPLKDSHLCSIVWSLSSERARQMYEVKPKIFNQALCTAFDTRLGVCSLESERQIFPLSGLYASQFAAQRLVLVGEAAHTIHPLAGQGINLGFMDAADLIGELRCLYHEGKDIGQYLYLRRYERNRKYSTAVMLAIVQGFYEIFDGSHPMKKLIRNLGLIFVNNFPSIKSKLLRQAMGFNDLPNWLSEV